MGKIFQTSDKQRFDLVAASPVVRPHQIVLFADAPQQERQHALEQIKRLMDEGDESAIAVLAQWRDSGLALGLSMHNPSIEMRGQTYETQGLGIRSKVCAGTQTRIRGRA